MFFKRFYNKNKIDNTNKSEKPTENNLYAMELVKWMHIINTHCEFECQQDECDENCSLRNIVGRRIGLSKIMNKPEY